MIDVIRDERTIANLGEQATKNSKTTNGDKETKRKRKKSPSLVKYFSVNEQLKYILSDPADKEVMCINCCEKVEKEDFWSIPIAKDYKLKIYYTTNIVCSVSCGRRFIFDQNKIANTRYDQSSQFFREMVENDTGLKINNFKMAPRRELLQKFGGPISIEDFHDANKQVYPRDCNTKCIQAVQYYVETSN